MSYNHILNKLLVGLFSIFLAQVAFPSKTDSPKVNVLTWWGFLADPWVHKMIMDKCHVKISYDEYYNDDNFLRRFREHKEFYDILIFPDFFYEMLKNEMRNNNSTVYKNADYYEKYAKANYKKRHYQHNIAYFLLDYSGFLYNPRNISISVDDTIETIFKKARNKVVVLADETSYVSTFLNLNPKKVNIEKAYTVLKNLTKNSKIIVTDTLSPAFNDPNFAFAYSWPGIALYAIENKNKSYRFIIHPKYTYVNADLIAVLTNTKSAQCVADVMASKKFLSKMQNDALYVSPYGDSNHITSAVLKKAHKEFFTYLPQLKWFNPVDLKEYNALDRAWSYYYRFNSNNKPIESPHE